MTLLCDVYDGFLLDLDGTAYRGTEAVPGAVEAVDALRRAGRQVGYVTNNASRSPLSVAAHLVELGFATDAEHVVASSQAGAALVAERVPRGSRVLVIGTDALADEVTAAGLVPVRMYADEPVAVLQGHSPDTGWAILAEACLAVRAGALWVACNVDPTLPTERGQLPGNGSMVAALRTATATEPVVAGKPERRLFDVAAGRLGLRRALVVGDRLDTDVAGATAAGMDALFVLTGVSTAADVLAAPPAMRPAFIAADMAALHLPVEASRVAVRPGWAARVVDGAVELAAAAPASSQPVSQSAPVRDAVAVDALSTLCAVWWAAGGGAVRVRATDDAGAAAARALALPIG